MPKTVSHVISGVFSTLKSTYAPPPAPTTTTPTPALSYCSFQQIGNRQTKSLHIASALSCQRRKICCFGLHSTVEDSGHRILHLRYSLLCLHHVNQGMQDPTCCEASSASLRAYTATHPHPLPHRGPWEGSTNWSRFCSRGFHSSDKAVRPLGSHRQELWASSKTVLSSIQ